MNIRQFIIALFRSHIQADDVATVQQSGQADGQAVATAYLDGFEAGASSVLSERLRIFQGLEESDDATLVIDRPKSKALTNGKKR